MPSICLRRGKPTYYLDTSTLSYAFRGGHEAFRDPREPAVYADLFALVERISRECNLCVSTMHIAELAQGREDVVRAMFSWLDSLALVWMYSFDKIGDREDEHALQRVVGAEPFAPVEPFAPSVLAAFEHWQFDALTEVLAQRSALHGLAEGARIRGVGKERAFMREMVARFHFDRHLDPSTLRLSAAEKKAITERKRRAELESEAARAWDRLRAKEVPDFHAKYRQHPDPRGAFADYVIAHPETLPSSYVAELFGAVFSEVMAGRKPGGGGAAKLESSLQDYAHLAIGAAYCDVFTCDALSAQCLGDAPEKVGRRKPIVFSGGEAGAVAFVRALERAV